MDNWSAEKEGVLGDARAIYFCANRAEYDKTNPQEVWFVKRAREIAEKLEWKGAQQDE